MAGKKEVLDLLKANGGKMSGGQVTKQLNIDPDDWKVLKTALKDEGHVELGRGRGGTLSLTGNDSAVVESVSKADSEEDIAKKRANNMAIARESKKRQSKEAQRNKEIIDDALERARKDFPDYHCEFHATNSLLEI